MEASNAVSISTTALACLCYCYFISSKIPKGLYRLISLLPVIYLSTAFLPAAATTTTGVLFLTSLANFLLSAPPQKKPINWSYIAAEFALLIALSTVLLKQKPGNFPPIVFHAVGCAMALLAVDCLGISANLLLRATVGLELQPPSDYPYLATSLQDFWGRRWNLAVTDLLRRAVYSPAKSASAAVVGKRWGPLAAIGATFTVSGLVHEVFFYELTKAPPSWEMTAFFVVQGIGVAAEVAAKKAVNGRWGLPGWISTPLTVGFVILTAYWLFFPPLLSNGLDLDIIVREEFKAFVGRA